MEFISSEGTDKAGPAFPDHAWTLLLPAVTVGNVGQLALDLLLSNLPCCHLGHLRAPAVLPMVGCAPAIPHHTVSVITAMEVYRLSDSSTPAVFVQQRAPVARGRAQEHAQAIIDWALSAGCSQILLLASANAAGRKDSQLRVDMHRQSLSTRLRFAATTAALDEGQLAARIREEHKWSLLENQDVRGWTPGDTEIAEQDRIHGMDRLAAFLPTSRKGAFVRCILSYCERKAVPLTTLLLFVHEGDNSIDACVLASAAALLVRIDANFQNSPSSSRANEDADVSNLDPLSRLMSRWKIPEAWLQNTAPPVGLY